MHWLIIALMVIVALMIVVWPLLRTVKDQADNRSEQNVQIAQEQLKKLEQDKQQGLISEEEYGLSREDLEKILYNDLADQHLSGSMETAVSYKASGVLIVLLPVLVFAIYYSLGSPPLVGISTEQIGIKPEVATEITPIAGTSGQVADVRSMFEKLRQRLEQNPNDSQGWMMMGLTYMHFKQYEQAVNAYTKAVALMPGNSDAQQALNRAESARSGSGSSTNLKSDIEKKMIAPNGQTVDVGAMVMRLRNRLEDNPENLQGWIMLGRSYMTLGQHNDAMGAYQNALRLSPGDPNIEALLKQAKEH
ncbi:MAG: c-type cytochrome biogenesis protein CcmI [Methylophagaceae bacterium]